MKELNVQEMEGITGGKLLIACVGAGLGAAAILSDPFAIFAIGDYEAIAITACFA